jgi:hypothetical protein
MKRRMKPRHPREPPKPRKPVVAVRGDDRPGMKAEPGRRRAVLAR